MGGSASKPARKLTKNIVNTDKITRSSRAHLPPQALRERFEKSGAPEATAPAATEAKKESSQKADQSQKKQESQSPAPLHHRFQSPSGNTPPGKDGMDPTADQAFIDSISKLGRQIHSEEAQAPSQNVDVRALKQLLNRKALYEKGQKEVKDQLDAGGAQQRTMIHPKTLLAILNVFHDEGVPNETVIKDYELNEGFLKNLSRFKVAQNIVPLQEDTKEDEVGPRTPKDRIRTQTTDEEFGIDGDVGSERLKQLRKRLE